MTFFETQIYHAKQEFRIENKPAGRMPIAVNADDGVVSPIQIFLLECVIRLGDHWRTAEKHGYHLCQWYDYLRIRNVYFTNADETHLRDFLLGGGTRYGRVEGLFNTVPVTLNSTNLGKMRCIISFYDFWERTRGLRLRVFRGGTLGTLTETLFKRRNRSISRAQINFSAAEASKIKNNPHTPTDEEANRIIDASLDTPDDNRAQTWYLITTLARRSGLRAGGISSLAPSMLFKALRDEPDIKSIQNYEEVMRDFKRPDNLALIFNALQRMKDRKRGFIYCSIRSKGGDWVPAAIPIDLCVELIDYICTHRQDVIERRFEPRGITPPDRVFLSYKPKSGDGAITQEAMSNTVNQIFKDLDIEGSLHRLRATFCEEVIRDLYIRERAINGRAWQINNVLLYASQLLGHKNPDTLEHYLNRILQQELILSGEPILVRDAADAPIIRGLCLALESGDGENIRTGLNEFLATYAIVPVEEDDRRYSLF